MPSIKKHGLSAVLLLCIIVLSVFIWFSWEKKNTRPETNIGEIELLAPKPRPNVQAKLPDLLAPDNIPQDENPTENIALIGGPKNPEDSASGPRPPGATLTSQTPSAPTTLGSKVIYIDGRAVGGVGTIKPFSAPLIRAPIQGLSRMSPFGRVPSPSANGNTALQRYAKPFIAQPKKQYISIVIGGLGLNGTLTKKAINELPGSVTLSFAANARDLQTWIDQARKNGHEVLLEIPMEGLNDNPDVSHKNHTLTSGNSASTNIRNLDYLMSRAEGYFALTNYDGENLLINEKAMPPILGHIKNAGLGFIYDGTLNTSRVQSLGQSQGLNIITANQFIDGQSHTREAVKQNIRALRAGTGNNTPIGMGFSYEGTINGLIDWLASKPEHIELAPVSYALQSRL